MGRISYPRWCYSNILYHLKPFFQILYQLIATFALHSKNIKLILSLCSVLCLKTLGSEVNPNRFLILRIESTTCKKIVKIKLLKIIENSNLKLQIRYFSLRRTLKSRCSGRKLFLRQKNHKIISHLFCFDNKSRHFTDLQKCPFSYIISYFLSTLFFSPTFSFTSFYFNKTIRGFARYILKLFRMIVFVSVNVNSLKMHKI